MIKGNISIGRIHQNPDNTTVVMHKLSSSRCSLSQAWGINVLYYATANRALSALSNCWNVRLVLNRAIYLSKGISLHFLVAPLANLNILNRLVTLVSPCTKVLVTNTVPSSQPRNLKEYTHKVKGHFRCLDVSSLSLRNSSHSLPYTPLSMWCRFVP